MSTRSTLFAALSIFLAFSARAELVQISIQPWSAGCPAEGPCGVPQGTGLAQQITTEIPAPGQAGSVGHASISFAAGLVAQVSFYSVAPHDATQPSYLQAKVEVLTPVRGLCAESVRWREPFEFPPIMCAVQNGKRLDGVTLVFSRAQP